MMKRTTIFKAMLAAGLSSALLYAGFYAFVLSHEEPACELPCPIPDHGGKSTCAPLSLDLQVSSRPIPSGSIYSVWHQISFQNQSCSNIEADVSVLLDGRSRLSGSEFSYLIWDPDGKPIAGPKDRLPFEPSVEPYRYDTNGNPYLREFPQRPGAVGFWYALRPGERLDGNSVRFDPHMEDDHPRDDRDAELPGSAYSRLRADLKAADKKRVTDGITGMRLLDPLPGYRVLEGWRFESAGRYRIQLIYEGSIFASRHTAWEKRLPFPLNILAENILIANARIPPSGIIEKKVRLKSPTREFTVAR
ncbi:MAG: hypothetical protein CO113_17285 [Elusimicrobia bacterium CG_4_9_14_3_um_filter_62_55]|nr:MAG: hypothetical protein CO113_17285 [Elusimicrobia bacterium CG_4_9_14_3_um_filter_62_55]